MTKVNLKTFNITGVQEYFIDTSVWLLLYGNLGNYKKADQAFYSLAFSEIIQKKSAILLTSIVLSEIANVLLKKGFKDFAILEKVDINSIDLKKDYIGTSHHGKTILFIETVITEISKLANLVRITDSFNDIDLSSILTNCKNVDFNDSYYLELLEKRNQSTIILTNDRDFNLATTTLDIYTNK